MLESCFSLLERSNQYAIAMILDTRPINLLSAISVQLRTVTPRFARPSFRGGVKRPDCLVIFWRNGFTGALFEPGAKLALCSTETVEPVIPEWFVTARLHGAAPTLWR